MINKLKNSFLIGIALFLFSCPYNPSNDLKDFQRQKDISVKRIKDLNDYSFLINPTKLILKNDLLYIGSSRTDTCFFVFSIPELNLVNFFGYRGPGPDEYKFPIIHDAKSEDKLFFSGFSNILQFREYDILSATELVEVSEFRLGVSGILNDAYFINDSMLIYNDIYNWNLPIVNYRKDLILDYVYHPEKIFLMMGQIISIVEH